MDQCGHWALQTFKKRGASSNIFSDNNRSRPRPRPPLARRRRRRRGPRRSRRSCWRRCARAARATRRRRRAWPRSRPRSTASDRRRSTAFSCFVFMATLCLFRHARPHRARRTIIHRRLWKRTPLSHTAVDQPEAAEDGKVARRRRVQLLHLTRQRLHAGRASRKGWPKMTRAERTPPIGIPLSVTTKRRARRGRARRTWRPRPWKI
jgi:hypothetical protein